MIISVFGLLGACASKNPNVPKDLPNDLKKSLSFSDISSLGIQLTKIGENETPFMSVDGTKLVFISHHRPTHTQPQVYIYDLESLKEKRLTYQDGECRDPIFLRDGRRILYASTTDELKERPLLLEKTKETVPWPPTEIYETEASGAQIKRLTQHEGFDGLMWPRPDRAQSVLFSQVHNQNLQVLQLNVENKSQAPLFGKKDKSIESMRLSPNGKTWAWIERDHDGHTQMWTAAVSLAPKTQKMLELPNGDMRDLIWWDDHKIIFSSQSVKKNYQLYGYDLPSSCLQTLFDHPSDLKSPQLHPNHQAMTFTSNASGSSQIYYKSVSWPDKCLDWKPAPPTPPPAAPQPTPIPVSNPASH